MAGGKPGSGVSGPWRGSFVPFTLGRLTTMSRGVRTTELGRFKVATGSEFVVTEVQGYASNSGTQGGTGVARITVLSGTTEICSELSLASNSVQLGTLVAAVATASGIPAGRGVPIVGATDIIATASSENCLDFAQNIQVTVVGFWRNLPSVLRGSSE